MSEVPPHNLDAERELLGSLLAYFTPALLASARSEIESSEDFYFKPHEITWRAICAVADAGDHVDALTVSRFLERQQGASGSFLAMIGGEATLHVLVAHAVPHGVRERAVMVAEDAEWRRRLVEAQRKVEACYLRDTAAYEAAGVTQRLRLVS